MNPRISEFHDRSSEAPAIEILTWVVALGSRARFRSDGRIVDGKNLTFKGLVPWAHGVGCRTCNTTPFILFDASVCVAFLSELGHHERGLLAREELGLAVADPIALLDLAHERLVPDTVK